MSGLRGVRPYLPAIGVGAGLFILLAAFVGADPAPGVTRSVSPYTDEGFNAIGAHNLVVFGRLTLDEWSLWVGELPFTLVLAGVFKAFGMGIVQARLMTIAATALTAALLAAGLRRPFGTGPGLVAAFAFGTSLLTLYYGRLVYLEDFVALGLTAGALTLVYVDDGHPTRLGLAAGALFAFAIGSKPSAATGVVGLLLCVAVLAVSSGTVRRWLAGAIATLVAVGLGWLVLVALPNRELVHDAMLIWPTIQWPTTLHGLVSRVYGYAGVSGDYTLARSLPLDIAAGAGFIVAVVRFRRLDPGARRVLVGSFGWLFVLVGVLALSNYRPNRYFVPALPALAIFVAPLAAEVERWTRQPFRLGRPVAGAALAIAVAAPGLFTYADWMRVATYRLPAEQAKLAALVPPGSVAVSGAAPTLLMSARVETIAPQGNPVVVNGGDVYTTRRARYYLAAPGTTLEPVARDHPLAWSLRRELGCGHWYNTEMCLYELP